MQASRSKATRSPHRNTSGTLSASAPASSFLETITNRVATKYGVSFFLIKLGEEKAVHGTELQETLIATGKRAVSEKNPNKVQEVEKLRQSAEAWSNSWIRSLDPLRSQSEQQFRVRPHLPAALLLLLADIGLVKASESLCLLGVLEPAAAVEQHCRRSVGTSATKKNTLQPIISLCINALEGIVDVTERLSQQAKAMYRHTSKKNAANQGMEMTSSDSQGAEDDENWAEKCWPRFFLLSPCVPYASLRDVVNRVAREEGVSTLATTCGAGEACEVLLVYDFRHLTFPGIGEHVPDHNPEIWGRVKYQQKQQECNNGVVTDGEVEVANGNGSSEECDELFFIAHTLEDYLRLGSSFSWVYGWQLCYASQGPPPRSLPWLKLFAPSALAAVVASNTIVKGSEPAKNVGVSAQVSDAAVRKTAARS
ncbi:hypothetical protein, conserved [Trypanosoma brucei gambiense DAL972]|uniref:Uncharacterized protein n=1 Tax=Trypanosoma brucei gambiense (strain MHOM/CI/86/DAL972) TaxID=679716 RepID=C9ZMC1_TRYB9|nr:hypothetical protein, conserved [Trypanosoma brucei gambiense DAL972]CBH10794.1 hypothetical protein, conserved [Trypanosoma brucei gambiense DAL972]|eukprot:XP_011773082.1 hypothetical protein, conserved [Trypanosoma brucei gambiense DAL972]